MTKNNTGLILTIYRTVQSLFKELFNVLILKKEKREVSGPLAKADNK